MTEEEREREKRKNREQGIRVTGAPVCTERRTWEMEEGERGSKPKGLSSQLRCTPWPSPPRHQEPNSTRPIPQCCTELHAGEGRTERERD